MVSDFHVTDRRNELDMRFIISALQGSYWGAKYMPLSVMRAMDASLCFGGYLTASRQQIAFARVVTDHALFSSITDMIVAEEHRRKGVGTALMKSIIQHPWVAVTTCILQTRVPAFYARHGFVAVGANVMRREPTV